MDKNMINIEIKQAKTGYLAQIQKLMDSLNDIRERGFSKQNKKFHERIVDYDKLAEEDLKNDIILVAKDNNNLVGYIWGSIHERKSHKLSKLGYIDELYVVQKFRKQGVVKKLANELFKEFKNKGCNHITTHTDFENDKARQFYEAIGMSVVTLELWKEV